MQMAGVDGARELDEGARAVDVGRDLRLGVGREVVDRRQVVDVIDLAGELLQVVGRDAEPLRRQIAVDRHDALAAARLAPVVEQRVELAVALGAQQEVDGGAASRQQRLDETPADESGRPGDEVAHA